MKTERPLGFVMVVLGAIGVAVCVGCVVGVWVVETKVSRASKAAFIVVDDSFVAVRERVVRVGQRVRKAKITTDEIEQRLSGWAEREVKDRLTTRLGVSEKAGQLAVDLRQADQWLELSESTVHLVRQAIKFGSSTGAPVKSDSVDWLLDELGSLRTGLLQVTNAVERISEETSEANNKKPLREEIDRAVQLALRIIATISNLESAVVEFEVRLSEVQTEVQQLNTSVIRWLRISALAVTLLLAWMLLGQWCLCKRGLVLLGRSCCG